MTDISTVWITAGLAQLSIPQEQSYVRLRL